MVIERNLSTPSTLIGGAGAAVAGAAAAAAAAAAQTPAASAPRELATRAFHQGALQVANQMAGAPVGAAQAGGANPLSTIPNSWFPMGQHNRPYSGHLGPVAIPGTSGTASVNRTPNSISLTSPHGNFSMSQDPNNPGRVVVDTPQGQYNGTLRNGPNGQVIFDTGNGQSVTMRRVPGGLFNSPYIEVNASGFGLPAGHLRVFN